MYLTQGDSTLKALVFFTLGVFTICVSGCGNVKNESNVAVESTTGEVVAEPLINKNESDVVVAEPPIVKREMRPLRPIGKRTAWTLDDIDLVEGLLSSDVTKNNPLLDFIREYEHAAL